MLFIDEAATERLSLPASERNALLHAVEKLEAFGPSLGFPHSSGVQGFPGLRELRPRAGRSRWRASSQSNSKASTPRATPAIAAAVFSRLTVKAPQWMAGG